MRCSSGHDHAPAPARGHDHVPGHGDHPGYGGDLVLDPAVVGPVVVGVLLVAYLVGAARLRAHGPRGWSGWRTAAFTAGALLAATALAPAADGVLGGGARGHMAQHLVLGMLAPLGLVLGAPVRLLLGAVPRARRPVARVLRLRAVHVVGHPVTAALLHVGGLWVLYLTPLYAWTLDVPAVHHLVQVHFVLAGYLFAWSLVGPDPAPGRPSLRVRAVVLVLAAAAHGILAKLLYAQAGTLPPGAAHPAAEAEQAAQWMYYGGDVAEVLLVVLLCSEWYRRGARAGTRPAGTASAVPGRVRSGTEAGAGLRRAADRP
ncbi:cytochrome c oxidase assembly protein [Cellulomonas sp. NS3]|uniref:cytochrome c oxidase assembly protein n=1 Tax=Cellulomonas sp. NS3 TaxID=2973977 RepID=UPI0021627C96|nr:cytochrome c oxidase assembly protein [Cellulomonas sp. NS3]